MQMGRLIIQSVTRTPYPHIFWEEKLRRGEGDGRCSSYHWQKKFAELKHAKRPWGNTVAIVTVDCKGCPEDCQFVLPPSISDKEGERMFEKALKERAARTRGKWKWVHLNRKGGCTMKDRKEKMNILKKMYQGKGELAHVLKINPRFLEMSTEELRKAIKNQKRFELNIKTFILLLKEIQKHPKFT
jgi:hypothetical protein